MGWSAEITNDPARDYELYVELLHNDEYRGRIDRDEDGSLRLTIYAGPGAAVPWDWLASIVDRYRSDVATGTEGED